MVASGLRVPWGVDFLPDGSAVVTERDSRRVLRIVPTADGPARVAELGVLAQAAPAGEAGLLGVAVSPDFAEDATVFLYATTAVDNRVLRVRLRDGRLGAPEVVLDGIPKGLIHDGGRLELGPDGLPYVSTGETGEAALAQNPDSLAGKILRITPDGGRLWASEFGDQTFDELNLVEAGGNYGWPLVEGRGGERLWRMTVRDGQAADPAPEDDRILLVSLSDQR